MGGLSMWTGPLRACVGHHKKAEFERGAAKTSSVFERVRWIWRHMPSNVRAPLCT